MRRRISLIAVIIASALCPTLARADADVDEGRRLYEEAEFLPALDAFARAEAADALTLVELAELYETRALVHLAMGNVDAMEEDLARLVVVDPDHAFDRRARPEVRSAFAEVRAHSVGAVRLQVSTLPSALGVTVSAQVDNDPRGMVRQLRIRARGETAAAWQEAIDAPLLVEAQGVVEYYVEAIGPGGARLASSGSEATPLRTLGGEAAGAVASSEGASGASDDSAVWIALGVIAAVLAVGAGVTVGVVVATQGDSSATQVAPFVVRF